MATSSLPGVAASKEIAEVPSNEIAMLEAKDERTIPFSATDLGFTRDQTIGNQVRQAIGGAEWDKKVTFLHF